MSIQMSKGLVTSIVSMLLLVIGATANAQELDRSRPNVLFIAVDDLRPQLGCYGKDFMQSPNIDRLAARGVLFERAYCMVPTCGASRAAIMGSVRPARERFKTHLTYLQEDAPWALPLHTHFKSQGYTTISLGKVFHHTDDHREGWSEKPWRSRKPGYQNQLATEAAIAENKRQWPNKKDPRGPAFEASDAPDESYQDGDCALRAIDHLERFATQPDQPFFLAVGFMKPHLPFNAPQQYWDLYDRASIDLPPDYEKPTDVPQGAAHNSGELRAYAGIHPSEPVDRETAISLIHGYYACVSFTDAQIGKLIDALDRLGLADNTTIVLWGDHGWQLGEHGMWNKHSCFETSMHAPLIIVPPRSVGIAAGGRVTGLVEFIDIYPTLCELSGLAIPEHVEGTSLRPLMIDPSAPGKQFAIGRFGNGDTIRTDQWRFSEYTGAQGKRTGVMLFNHETDTRENRNVAEATPTIVQELAGQLNDHKGKSR